MKTLRLLTALILLAGTCLTARAAYLDAKARLAGFLIRRAWTHTSATGEPRAPWPWADTHPIARLQIPRLGYDEIVLDAATPRSLNFGPALVLSATPIGKPGNVVLAGHRTSWFHPLENIAPGDSLQISWFDTRHNALVQRTYTVNLIQVVEPQNLALLEPTPDDALTLITCYPFGSSPHSPLRFIVRATPLGPSRPTEDTVTVNARSSASSISAIPFARPTV